MTEGADALVKLIILPETRDHAGMTEKRGLEERGGTALSSLQSMMCRSGGAPVTAPVIALLDQFYR